jgi:hypothetical protein
LDRGADIAEQSGFESKHRDLRRQKDAGETAEYQEQQQDQSSQQ